MDPRRLLPWLAGVTAVVLLATVLAVLVTRRGDEPTAEAARAAATAATAEWRDVLADWDAERSRAWGRGDLRALRELYVAGSLAGRRDVRMLRAYTDRGLVVRGLSTQLLSAKVISSSATRLVLRTTDRIVGGEVTVRAEAAERGGAGTRLPRDRPTTRIIEFRRVEGDWRMASVRQAD